MAKLDGYSNGDKDACSLVVIRILTTEVRDRELRGGKLVTHGRDKERGLQSRNDRQTLTTFRDVTDGATVVLKVKVDAVATIVLLHTTQFIQER